MNKITKFLLIILLILIGAYFLLTGFVKETDNIADKVGARVGGGELSVTEYYSLAQCFETYKNYLSKKDYNTAYIMLGHLYRRYVPYEEYEKNILTKNVSEMQIEDINIITSTTFDLLVDTSGEKEHYSIIIDNKTNKFTLLPESFLDYKAIDIEESKKKLECTLKDYVVYIDKCVLNFEIKNNNKKEEINISKATLFTNMESTLENNEIISIKPGETKSIQIAFETDYEFPTKVVLERIENKKSIEYSYEF